MEKHSLNEMLNSDAINKQKSVASSFKSAKRKKKNKMISAYVNIDNYDLFTLINYELGESNNKIINQLIESWIKKHKNLL
jgi:c-di-AMP phosphodiesterase-like protein